MKKHLAILFLAAGMLLGGAQQGQAVDFKAKGVWINMLEYGGGGNFVKNDEKEPATFSKNSIFSATCVLKKNDNTRYCVVILFDFT